MTTAFIITLTLLLVATIAYAVKKGGLNAVKDDFSKLEELTSKKDAIVTEYGDRIETLSANLKEADDAISQFRSKVDELLVTNEGLKNEIAGLNRKNSSYQSKLKEIEKLKDEQGKELARFQAEAKDLRDEYDALQKVYDDLASRLVTVSREMPAGLVSSRKAERLSVSLRQYITETPEGASLQIVAPFHPSDTSDEK